MAQRRPFDLPPGINLLNFLLLISFILQCSNADENLTTVLVCEGGLASLHCPPQHEIAVHLANFGRFALHTCNPTMRLDINVKCHNPHTIDVLRASCDHRQNCAILASTEVFNDTCPQHSKYLEASFECRPSKATTTTSTTTLSTISAASTTIALPSAGKLPFDGGGEIQGSEEDEGNGGEGEKSPIGCPLRIARHLHWLKTPLGQIVRLPCPKGSRGQAEWKCSPEGNWTPESGPNLSRCISDWARELKEDLEELGIESSGEQRRNWLELLREGHAQVRKEELSGGDARVLGEVIGEIADKMAKKREAELGTGILLLSEHNEEMRQRNQQEALEFVRLIIDTLGHLLRKNQRATWMDLPPPQRRTLAVELLQIMPKTLSLLLPLPNWPKAGSESLLAEPTLVAEVAQASIYDYVPFPSMSLYRQNFDTVLLPREALQLSGQDLANVFYTAWDPSLGDHLMGEEEKGEKLKRRKIITKMVGISMVPPHNGKIVHSKQIERPILLTFQNAEYLNGGGRIVGEPKCVWWNWEAQEFVEEFKEGNEGEGGCQLREHNETHILCECSRVNTEFAVMANVEGNGDEGARTGKWVIGGNQQSTLLCILLAISASISLLGLCLSLIILIGRNSTQTKGEQINVALTGRGPPQARTHFCVLFLLLEAIFLGQIVAQNDPPCKLFAIIRDFIILAILFWTFLDAFELCQSARHLFSPSAPNEHPKSSSNCSSFFKIAAIFIFGYGSPFLLILLAISILNWPPKHCWSFEHFQPNISFAFISPISFILVATISFLFATFWALRSGNAKCAQKSGAKFFAAVGYHPCSTNSTLGSGNQSTQQREERRMLAELRQRLKWICARVTLLAVAISSTICWASIFGMDGMFSFLLAFAAILANAGIGMAVFCELITDKKTQSAYCRWRIEKYPPNSLLLKPLDLLLCFSASSKNGHFPSKKAANGSIEFPKIKFAHSPTNVGNFTPNSSSTSSGANANMAAGGIGNGAMSACSAEFSTTDQIQLSSSSNNSGSEGFSNHPPPPAPLLQLYQEHKMLQQQRNAGIGEERGNNFGGYGGNEGAEAYDEYATIPYEELLTAFHRHKLRQQQNSPAPSHHCPSARPIPTPRGLYSSPGPPMAPCSYSPRILPSNNPPQSHLAAMNNYMGGPIYSPGPYPIRLGLIGGQQQVSHQPPPMGIIGNPNDNFLPIMHHYGPFQMATADLPPPILEMGMHSAPPNFPPPPPPAPSADSIGHSMAGDHAGAHFRRSSSGSLRSGGSTLVLRMDLSRHQPLISERIDDVEDLLDEADEMAGAEEMMTQQQSGHNKN